MTPAVMTEQKFVDLGGASLRTGISTSTLRGLIRNKKLTAHRVDGRGKILLRVEELDALVQPVEK